MCLYFIRLAESRLVFPMHEMGCDLAAESFRKSLDGIYTSAFMEDNTDTD